MIQVQTKPEYIRPLLRRPKPLSRREEAMLKDVGLFFG